MFQTVFSQAMLFLSVGTLVFAWLKGGPAERLGALVNVGLSFMVTVFQGISDAAFGTIPILIADGLIATGFLILALRFASLWLAAAMVLQGAVFTLHAAVLIELVPDSHLYYYYAVMNAAGMAVLLAIVAGTVASWLRHNRLKREGEPTPPELD